MAIPVYALSKSGRPLIAASFHPAGAAVAVERARAAGAEVSGDGRMVDGEWLRGELRAQHPERVPMLSALLISIVQQGMLLSEVQRIKKGEIPPLAS